LQKIQRKKENDENFKCFGKGYNMSIEAMKQAQGYLDRFIRGLGLDETSEAAQVKAVLDDAIEKMEKQEPVASYQGPHELWLQLHGDCSDDELEQPVDYTDDSVTWCWHQIHDSDVRYVRADIATPPAAPVQNHIEDNLAMVAAPVQESRDWSLLEATQESLREHMAEIGRLKAAQRQWVGLTQQDIDVAFDDTQEGGGFDEFARAIESKLREKNGGGA
jgi:hypothetical protein